MTGGRLLHGSTRCVLGLLVALGLIVTTDALGQVPTDPDPRALTGVLKRIKDSGVVRLGYREAALPFSWRGAGGQPYGYAIDLCLAIVEDIAESVDRPGLRIEYSAVTPQDRIARVTSGGIDLECGATTNTPLRRRQVAFSPVTFLAGTQLLVRRGAGVRSLRNLSGQRIAVVRGTSNEEAMQRWQATGARNIELVTTDDYAAAVALLRDSKVAALAADDVLLYAFVAERGLTRELAIVGELLSYEPYGIMYARGDAALDELVQHTFRRLATSRELRVIYNRWFLRPLPSGITLGLPMSTALERAFQLQGLPVD